MQLFLLGSSSACLPLRQLCCEALLATEALLHPRATAMATTQQYAGKAAWVHRWVCGGGGATQQYAGKAAWVHGWVWWRGYLGVVGGYLSVVGGYLGVVGGLPGCGGGAT